MTEAIITPPSEDQVAAAKRLEAELRDGNWRRNALWLEFVSLPHDPADYQRLRQLWLDSPGVCRNRSVPMAVVARAAMLEEEHAEARLLLRKAILARTRYNRRLSVRLRLKGRNRPTVTVPPVDEVDTPTRDTTTYLELYNAVVTKDRAARERLAARLAQLGEGEWLNRL
ncbi:hypothetical protein [Stackebrandtia nassauensis]|uniref:Uncharacterized protein n=1 Tax=Stackebrandtia nassauensis (strain DSM 44728 / CIP 108903 / NRRL B-16338 / NBRC 102104 / LLR-40K-21) TaxID=446470 RepID=D3PW41_STANL|nr:hypothetical protein [Stackebrandtia nassauensis]ADD41198.1 hypothetical protein Snas_1494 [Stackebrandtia nassauensis DSM 44728]